MKRVAALMLGVALLTAAPAFADTIENGYGNTFLITQGTMTVRYFFNADGTFSATAPDGSTQAGRYELTNGQICFLGQGDQRACAPVVTGKNVGDTWEQLDANGNPITVTLQAGR